MAYLPDLVTNEIIRRVTTKTAVCMSFLSKQWQDMLPSLPMLDFDEGGDNRFDTDGDFVQHKKFTNVLQYYLGLCDKDRRQAKKPTPLDKFRLRMRRYSCRDASMVYKLLSYSIEREVKELDISLGGSFTVKNYYYLCRTNLLNAKSLTTLNLEYVRMKSFDRLIDPIDYSISLRLLPCLKTMSLKNVHFDPHALLFFVWECPYIEHLSLASCSFDIDEFEFQGIQITSPTLKSLEMKNCEASRVELYVEDLESLTIISSEFHLTGVVLKRCLKLKQVNIEASHLEYFSLSGKCDNVNAIIDAPALYCICYKAGLDSKFSLNTLDLYTCHIEPFKGELPFDEPWKYFQKLKDCLQQFVSSKEMILCADHFEDLTFPEDFRNTLALPILPNLTYVELVIRNPPTHETATQELNDSLYWMAPAIRVEPYYRSDVS